MTTQTARGVLHGRSDSMLRTLARGGWKERGTCNQTDPELWFADTSRRVKARAALICGSCPVRRQCLAWALVFDEEYGVWGGLDATGRLPLQRRLSTGEPLPAVLAVAMAASSTAPSSPRAA
ncbi:WhiB family transcriptional regulator [Intrasporangium sp. YIM S08009]|uniref:WhiB family transcriptional regulator n=1 Tax=Intrasporangium zincisolvens TaxID=3080018 RepID=UPI002B05627F|nr:WhiB family transcriptional regulator [Intrasporangium sp. YIM S08009]